jgi:hypothetical protein
MAQYWPFGRLCLAYFLGLKVTVVEDEAAKEGYELYEPVQGIHGYSSALGKDGRSITSAIWPYMDELLHAKIYVRS